MLYNIASQINFIKEAPETTTKPQPSSIVNLIHHIFISPSSIYSSCRLKAHQNKPHDSPNVIHLPMIK